MNKSFYICDSCGSAEPCIVIVNKHFDDEMEDIGPPSRCIYMVELGGEHVAPKAKFVEIQNVKGSLSFDRTIRETIGD